jgi:hypothetical protein
VYSAVRILEGTCVSRYLPTYSTYVFIDGDCVVKSPMNEVAIDGRTKTETTVLGRAEP